MKIILFRPTFVSAATMFQCVALWCILFISVAQAAPQFGLSWMHALDESEAGVEPVPSGTVDPPAAVVDPAAAPVVNVGDAAPTVDPTVAVNAAVSSTSSSSEPLSSSTSAAAATPSSTTTSGASHAQNMGGVHTALLLSAAASAVFLVF